MIHKKTPGILLGLLVSFVVTVFPLSNVEAATIDLISPANGSKAGPNTVFQWEPVGVQFYRLEINGDIVVVRTESPSAALSTIASVSFKEGQAYQWKVYGCDPAPPPQMTFCPHESSIQTFSYSKSSIIEFRPPTSSTTLEDLLQVIMRFMFYMAIALAPLFYVAAGFILVVGGGDPKKVQLAKDIFLWTTVGFVVILIAAGLEMVIRDILGVRQ